MNNLEFKLNQINKRIDELSETSTDLSGNAEFESLKEERRDLMEQLKIENRRLLNKWCAG